MDKYDFIKRLEIALEPLSIGERITAVDYYKELLEEAGNENVAEFISHLESPEVIAEGIIRESGMISKSEPEPEVIDIEGVAVESNSKTEPNNHSSTNQSKNDDKTSNKTYKTKVRSSNEVALSILVLILGFPIWFPIALTVVILAIVFIIVAIVLISVFGVVGVALIIAGLPLFVSSFGAGLALIGVGMVCVALMIFSIPLFKICVGLCKWIITTTVSLLNGLIYKKEAVA